MSLKPVVAAAILDDSQPPRLLAARRSYPPALRGLYELPGGKIEPGEPAETALLREIREELGTEIIIGQPLPAPRSQAARPQAPLSKAPQTRSASAPAFSPWIVNEGRPMWVWLAMLAPDSPAPKPGSSHEELTWAELSEALNLPWIPADLPIVRAVIEATT